MSSIVFEAGNGGRSDETSSIERHGDVVGYFHERVVAALAARAMTPAQETEFYLVKVLSDAHAEPAGDGAATLVELYERAAASSGRERIGALRRLGDRALYLSGFFDEYLERRGLSRRYFAQMGEGAYEAAFALAAKSEHLGDRARAPVFRELGERFVAFADVFVEVREATSMRTADGVLALYRRFERTRSQTLASRLAKHGVFPARGGGGPLH